MFTILGLKENVKNLATLCKPHLSSTATKKDLKQAYKSFLTHAQPNVPRSDTADILFLYKPAEIAVLLKLFEEDSVLDDFEEIFDSTDSLEHQLPILKVQDAILQMHEIAPSFHDLMHLVINTIFSAPSKLAGGGSTSAAIGCIWVNIRKHWQEQDVLEFLVHETTHNLVFLDELCHAHYRDYSKLPKEENYSWSAILNKPRPLDKVFHSIIVSTEVLQFRNDYLGHPTNPCLHPPTDIMLKQALHSIDYLNKNQHLRNLLTDRANYLLDICAKTLKSLETTIPNNIGCCV